MAQTKLGEIAGRRIKYVHLPSKSRWQEHLPASPWTAFVFCDEVADIEKLGSIADICLKHGAHYICSTGKKAGLVETVFDKNEIFAVTTSHSGFDEGFWFACICATSDGDTQLKTVVCLSIDSDDLTLRLRELISRINSGWSPEV